MEIWVTETFEASHSLRQPIGSPTLHGHSYWVRAFFDTSSDTPTPQPMLQGYLGMVTGQLDHTHLNERFDDPTMEAIAEFVAQELKWKPTRVQVWRESVGTGVEWRA